MGLGDLCTRAELVAAAIRVELEMDVDVRRSRGITNKRVRRRKNRKFKGRKERLREEIKTLKTEKEEYVQRNSNFITVQTPGKVFFFR